MLTFILALAMLGQTTADTIEERWDDYALYHMTKSELDHILADEKAFKDEIASLKQENAELKERIEELENQNPPTAEFLWADQFDSQPEQGAGKYLITAPSDKIIARNGQLEMTCISDQPKDENGRIRTEMNFWDPNKPNHRIFNKEPFQEERWYSFGVDIPNDWYRDPNKVLFFQVHGSEDEEEKGLGREPCLSFFLWNKNFYIRQLWSDNRIQTGNENRTDLVKKPFVFGRHDYVIHLLWDYNRNGPGFLEIWEDGIKIVDQRGPNCYNDELGTYLKFGMYWPSARYDGEYPSGTTHFLIYDYFYIGDSRNKLEDFLSLSN